MYEQPLGDSSALPTSLLMKSVSEAGYKVAYGGDGGDELFFGYLRHKKFGDIYHFKKYLNFTFKLLENIGIKIGGTKINKLRDLLKAENISEFILLTRNLSRNIFDYSELHHGYENNANITLEMKYFDLKSIFANDLMVKTDRSSMYYGVEVRNPLIDYEFNRLSDELILRDNFFYRKNKKTLKQITNLKNPSIPQKRNKKGFSVPVDLWITNYWKDWAMDLMSDFFHEKRFDYNYADVRKIFNDHMSNQVNSRDFIWSILMYQNWLNE